MIGKQESLSRTCIPQADGSFLIPITSGVDERPRSFNEEIIDADFEPYDPSKHDQRLLSDLRDLPLLEDSVTFEQESIEIDPYSFEGLNQIRSFLAQQFKEMNDWRMDNGTEKLSAADEELYDYLRNYFSHINDLIRQQKTLVESDDFEQDAVGESLGQDVNRFLKMKALLLSTADEGQVEHIVDHSNEDGLKTGWWDSDFKKEKGQSVRNAEGTLKQVWGDEEVPLGFEPPVLNENEQLDRTGWWKEEYLSEHGQTRTPLEGMGHVQRGATSDPSNTDTQTLNRLVSSPVGGRKGEVKWSLERPEEVPTNKVAIPEQIFDVVNLKDATVVLATSVLAGEKFATPTNRAYEKLRGEWLTAKVEHEAAHHMYEKTAAEYYRDIKEQSFTNKNWIRLKATFGFKPQLPVEIQNQRETMFDSTARYNELARQMLLERGTVGKSLETLEDKKREKVLARYHKMLARTTLLNTFNSQLEMQKKATDSLPFQTTEFMKHHGKKVRLIGAAAIGGITGGMVGGGLAIARVLAGGAAAGVTTKFVGEKMNSYVERVSDNVQAEYLGKVSAIESRLAGGTLSAKELQDIYDKLSVLYYQVDTATQTRIVALIGTALWTGLLVGGASGYAMEGLGIGTEQTLDDLDASISAEVSADKLSTEQPLVADDSLVDTKTEPLVPEAVLPPVEEPLVTRETEVVKASPLTSGVGAASESDASTTEATTYAAQKGDNLWDIMEGQTKAGTPAYLEHVAEVDKQKLIALVAERINENSALRAEIGFGDTADSLNMGAEVDMARLNQLAEEIARENNLYVEITPEVPTVESVVATESSIAAAPVESVEIKSAERLITVSPEKVNQYALDYPGNHPKFRADFENNFVNNIQGPVIGGGLLSWLLGSGSETTNAYNTFDSYSIKDFKELATVDEDALTRALAEKNIALKDYHAWRDALATWEVAGLLINPNDRFSYVAETAFINSLDKTAKP